jgi:hypothetical protein
VPPVPESPVEVFLGKTGKVSGHVVKLAARTSTDGFSFEEKVDWSALEDDFRTFLALPGNSGSIFQQFTV